MVRVGARARLHVFCEKPLTLSAARRRASWPRSRASAASSPRSATTTASSAASARSRTCSTPARSATSAASSARPTARSCCKRKGGTWRSRRTRAAAASTTTPPTRSTCSTGIWASRPASAARSLTSIFSARDRRRGLQHPVLSTTAARRSVSVNWSDESCRKMTTRITALGHRRADLRRPPGMPGLPARHRADPGRLRAGLERPLHDRAHRAGRLLPARRGVQRPVRPLRRAGPRRRARRPERLRERRGRPTARSR